MRFLSSLCLLASATVALTSGCDTAKSADEASISMKVDNQFVLGSKAVARYSPDGPPHLVLSRTIDGGGTTVFFTFPSVPTAGTYQIVDRDNVTGPIPAGKVSAATDSRDLAAIPEFPSHKFDGGTLTVTAVTATSVKGTFTSTMRVSQQAKTFNLTGSFKAVK